MTIFDLFEDWFERKDYEGCLFTTVMLEVNDGPVFAASVARCSFRH